MTDPSVPPIDLLPAGTILLGLTGSRAFGLATPESDYDWKGIFVAPTRDVLSPNWHSSRETFTRSAPHPDISMHELVKFCRLALTCNPTVLEMLWLEEFPVLEPLGQRLVDLRSSFLSDRCVRAKYFGYAKSQFVKFQKEGTFPDRQRAKAKHARHLFRLLDQGEQLLTTGTMSVRVQDPERIHALGNLPDGAMVKVAEKALARFDEIPCGVLPEEPDTDEIVDLIYDARVSADYT